MDGSVGNVLALRDLRVRLRRKKSNVRHDGVGLEPRAEEFANVFERVIFTWEEHILFLTYQSDRP